MPVRAEGLPVTRADDVINSFAYRIGPTANPHCPRTKLSARVVLVRTKQARLIRWNVSTSPTAVQTPGATRRQHFEYRRRVAPLFDHQRPAVEADLDGLGYATRVRDRAGRETARDMGA